MTLAFLEWVLTQNIVLVEDVVANYATLYSQFSKQSQEIVNSIKIEVYTDKSYVIVGNLSSQVKDQMKEFKGCTFVKILQQGKFAGQSGWVLQKSRLDKFKEQFSAFICVD